MVPAIGHVIYGIEGRASYALRALDERALFDIGADPDQLLSVGVQAIDGYIQPEELGALPIVDLELMLAHFCIANFGDVVGQNLTCASCNKKYAVEFSLAAYTSLLTKEVSRHTSQDFRGYPLALPSRDVIATVPADALVPALWGKTDPIAPDDLAALEDYLEKACPVLQEDIGGPCPDCQTHHSFRFVLREWVTAKLGQRLRQLAAMVHLLAAQYHWRVDDIFALSKASRLALLDTIQGRKSRAAPVGPR